MPKDLNIICDTAVVDKKNHKVFLSGCLIKDAEYGNPYSDNFKMSIRFIEIDIKHQLIHEELKKED